MLIAWTTVSNQSDAHRLADEVLGRGLAACVQIEGPIRSHYLWQGKLAQETEFRLTFKFLPDRRQALEEQVLAHHPYDTPEWIVVRAEHVAEKYLSWARANSSK